MKVVISTGDSWTAGQGSAPHEIQSLKLGYQDPLLCHAEITNSWGSILCREFLQDYTHVMQGCKGIGNRAAVRNLYFINPNFLKEITDGYLIFLLSNWDRADYFNDQCATTDYFRFKTLRPQDPSQTLAWEGYFKELHNDNASIAETMCSIIEAQNFAKLHNLKFIFASAFDHRGINEFKKFPILYNQINIDAFLHNHVDYDSFLRLLTREDTPGDHKLLSPCSHPNLDGYRIIATEFYKFISNGLK